MNSDAEEDTEISHTAGSFKEKCADLEKKMKDTMNELKRSTDGKSLQQCSTVLKQNAREWLSMEDQHGRTCRHVTVEENNIRLTECLLVSGAEVNRPEGCGVTPLMIAIIKEQLEMTQLLLKYHAKAHGTFAGLIPSPLQLAESTNNDLIASLLKNHIGKDVQEEKAIFSAYLNSRTQDEPTANDPCGCHVQDASSHQDDSQRKTVITFGDQKTCSNVRSEEQGTRRIQRLYRKTRRFAHRRLSNAMLWQNTWTGWLLLCCKTVARKTSHFKKFPEDF